MCYFISNNVLLYIFQLFLVPCLIIELVVIIQYEITVPGLGCSKVAFKESLFILL